MVKRRTDSDSEDEVNSGSATPPSKRARTESSDEEEQESIVPKRENKSKGKQRARQTEEDDDAGVPGEEDEEGEHFERQHRQKILDNLEEKRKIQGGIAEHGIIEGVEMHQFMCHRYLTFNFGPQINFIIGHNGSGKSAVLSAITVALGGKANSTGRGNGLKSFIREGQSVSEVTITLKNQGEEAYKPDEYGKSIVITRRFTKEGSSSWKIKSKDGRVISTKKDELSAICDHMNIQVDNPMNVLTQDAARQFLSASHPSDKYKFFLRGTQLSQLSDEYDTCLENITQTSKILAQKKEALPELKAVFRDATLRFEEAAKAREQKKKVDELKKELCWSHVRAKEEEMTAKIEEAAKMSRRLPKIQASIDEATTRVNTATEDVTRYEAQLRDLGDIDDLSQQKNDVQAEIRHNKTLLSDFNADLKRMDTSLKATDQQIESLEAQIQAESLRMAAHSQAKHEETQRRIEVAREAVHSVEGELNAVRIKKREQISKNDALKQEGMAAEQELNRVKNSIESCQGMIDRSMQSEKNSLIPYGRNIKEVLEKIRKMTWFGDTPLGPLGTHVKARDPKVWGDLLRNQIGSFLTAFAITDARDRKELKALLERNGNPKTLIIIYEKDMFDYSQGEPPEHILTVLRALEISDPYVMRILINQSRIERQILSHRRKEGEDILKTLRGGSAWTLDGFQVRVFGEGGASSTPLNTRRANDATSLLLTGRDAASEIRHYREEIQGHEANYQALNQNILTLRGKFDEGRRAVEALNAQENRLGESHRRAKASLITLQQEANDEMPTGVAGFQAAKEEAEAEKASTVAQAEDVMKQKSEIDEKQKILLTKMNELKAKHDKFEQGRSAIVSEAEEAAARRLQAQSDKKHFEAKYAEEDRKVKQVEAVATVLQTEFTNWTEKAEEYCERVENPRKTEEVERNLKSVQKALAEREKRHGATVEQMTIEVNKAKDRYEKAENDYKQMSKLNKALKESLVLRLHKWQEFRRHIALRCKLVFGFHLSQRGYYGKVLFNHDQGTLTLKVQTDDQILAIQGSRDKDPRSLSGGEKSFSTICLLLSLWESIGCPLRCLDEFDVFMDAVNRRISMKMMIDTANSSDKKQYILITPQDMNNVHLGSTVRVNRMTDPERGQAVLAF